MNKPRLLSATLVVVAAAVIAEFLIMPIYFPAPVGETLSPQRSSHETPEVIPGRSVHLGSTRIEILEAAPEGLADSADVLTVDAVYRSPKMLARFASFMQSRGSQGTITPTDEDLAAFAVIERGNDLRHLITRYENRELQRLARGEASIRLADEIDAETRAWINVDAPDPARFWSLVDDFESSVFVRSSAIGDDFRDATDDPPSKWDLVREINTFTSLADAATLLARFIDDPDN